MSEIDEIKTRIDIVDLISETVKLRRSGKNYSGFCPFHSNTRTPAFVVFPESGTWRCFGQCSEGGDIFGFVMKRDGLDFPQAISFLAQRAGVVLEPLTPEKQAQEQEHERIRALLEESVLFYQHHLLQNSAGKDALVYLKNRGIETKTMELFGLGFALRSWDAAMNHFTAKGYSNEELMEAGLITERNDGSGYYDRFRNRILFPIRDSAGHMAGFGARVLDPEDIPKFINSPQTPLFDKGRLLYGLDLARKAIRTENQVVFVEGYLDVITLHQAGFCNTVSPMGTALTEDQLKQVKRLSRNIVLALDADAAGEKATMRGLEIARQTLDRTSEISFDARGLLHYEARLQADLRVTTIPSGMDPDEVVLRDPDEWRSILNAARPIVVHVMETLAGEKDLSDAKQKRQIAEQVLPLIEDVPSSVERDAYRQQLARLLKVDERSLAPVKAVRTAARGKSIQSDDSTRMRGRSLMVASETQRLMELETHILSILMNHPDLLHGLNRSLLKAGLERLRKQDLDYANHQLLINVIQSSLEQDEIETHRYILDKLPQETREFVQSLQNPQYLEGKSTTRIQEDLFRAVISLRQIHVRALLDQLRFMQEDQQADGIIKLDPDIEGSFLEFRRQRDRLDKALRQTALQN